jgi:UTP:GlnB (protein PII) uridylyltransferase
VTTPSAVVKDTFRVTCAGGGPLDEQRLGDLRKAVVTCASKSYATKRVASEAAGKLRMADANVEVMSFDPPSQSGVDARRMWVIRVTAQDAPGALSTIVAALFGCHLDVVSAEVRTTADGRVNNQFQVLRPDGTTAGEVTDMLKRSLANM